MAVTFDVDLKNHIAFNLRLNTLKWCPTYIRNPTLIHASTYPTRDRVYHALMTIHQRHQAVMTSNGDPQSGSESISERTNLLSPTDRPKLLSYEESLRLVPWQTDNEYVLSGYRRQLGSVKACLWSAVSCASMLT
jgi:hypothetical protein